MAGGKQLSHRFYMVSARTHSAERSILKGIAHPPSHPPAGTEFNEQLCRTVILSGRGRAPFGLGLNDLIPYTLSSAGGDERHLLKAAAQKNTRKKNKSGPRFSGGDFNS